MDDGDPDRELDGGDDRAEQARVRSRELRGAGEELLGPAGLAHRVVDDHRAEPGAEVRGLELEQRVHDPENAERDLDPREPQAQAGVRRRLGGGLHGAAYPTVSVPVMNGWIWQ